MNHTEDASKMALSSGSSLGMNLPAKKKERIERMVHPCPGPSGSADLCFEAVCVRLEGLTAVNLENACDMALSSRSNLTCAGLQTHTVY